jgi:hypothetical protein
MIGINFQNDIALTAFMEKHSVPGHQRISLDEGMSLARARLARITEPKMIGVMA